MSVVIDELALKRQERLMRQRHQKVSALLRQVSRWYDAGKLENRPHAAVVVLISEHGPEVAWAGFPSRDELYLAADAIKRAYEAIRCGEDPRAAVEALVEQRARIKRYNEERERAEQRRREEYERTRPFVCSHPRCSARFKTQAALTRHERHHCIWYRMDRQQAES